ncbi:hypothetical protein [Flavobacterium facile]|uniref:hypothetical protein n=1 Tax=Flavobacterium facile TaxID=2893174 RepID=UPI002E780604|nr:hypothetical protein [Flavobacterium sp. T-12]
MKKEVIQIGSGVLAGALSRGLTGTMLGKSSNTVKTAVSGVLCVGMGFAATKVTGTGTKADFLRGAALGVSIAQGFEVVKSIFSNEKIASKLNSETASGRFLQKATGLSGAVNGLNGYTDVDGNYHEDGLGGYIDPYGNLIEDGLGAYEIEDGLGAYEIEDGLGAYEIEDGLAGFDDEDGLGAYEIEDGLGVYDDEDGLGGFEEQEDLY